MKAKIGAIIMAAALSALAAGCGNNTNDNAANDIGKIFDGNADNTTRNNGRTDNNTKNNTGKENGSRSSDIGSKIGKDLGDGIKDGERIIGNGIDDGLNLLEDANNSILRSGDNTQKDTSKSNAGSTVVGGQVSPENSAYPGGENAGSSTTGVTGS